MTVEFVLFLLPKNIIIMKSLSKQDNKNNLKKRANSSLKFSRPFHRKSGAEIMTFLSKSTMIKQLSSKDRIINNYVAHDKSQKMIKTARCTVQKRPLIIKVNTKNIYEQYLMKNSDKMKLLYWNDDQDVSHLSKIVISADFIINQDCFWDNTKVDQERNAQLLLKSKNTQENQGNLVKIWKVLHKYHYVIWIIRKKNSLKKLQQIITANSLPLHAIFYIKKKKNFTVDYSPVIKEIQKQKHRKKQFINENKQQDNQVFQFNHLQKQILNIFQIIKTNAKDNIDYHSYSGRVPILLQNKAKVYFLRVQSEPPGLDLILKCLQKSRRYNSRNDQEVPKSARYKPVSARFKSFQVYLLSTIRSYIDQYMIRIDRRDKDRQAYVDDDNMDWQYDQQVVQSKLSQMKKSLVDYFLQEYGRNYQFQGGCSIYNFVGEMFKRNYKILYSSFIEEMLIQKRKHHKAKESWKKQEIVLNIQIDYFQMS